LKIPLIISDCLFIVDDVVKEIGMYMQKSPVNSRTYILFGQHGNLFQLPNIGVLLLLSQIHSLTGLTTLKNWNQQLTYNHPSSLLG
jgi:hypothetical protein